MYLWTRVLSKFQQDPKKIVFILSSIKLEPDKKISQSNGTTLCRVSSVKSCKVATYKLVKLVSSRGAFWCSGVWALS